jgi:hypothetical protein
MYSRPKRHETEDMMCSRRDDILAGVPTPELNRRISKVEHAILNDENRRLQAEREGRARDARHVCAQIEHRRAWLTSYQRELDRRV